MGTFLNWLFGCEPNPPKKYPPGGLRGREDESWREELVADSFNVFLPRVAEPPAPSPLPGILRRRMPHDLRVSPEEHPSQSTFSWPELIPPVIGNRED